MKKILVFVSSDLCTDNRVHRTCQAIHELGYEVQLYGRRKKNSPALDKRLYFTKQIKMVFQKGPLFYAALNIRFFLIGIFSSFHLLYSNDLDTLPACYLVSQIRRKKIIYDSHELFTEAPELIHRPKIQRIWERIEQYIFPKLQYVITVNESIALEFQKRYGLKPKVIRNVPSKIKHPLIISKASLGIQENNSILIIQGSGLNVERGIEEAVLAMKNVENAVLVLVGDGDVLPKVKKMVSDHQLEKKVRFFGRRSYEDMMAITRLASIGLALDKPLSLNYKYALPNKLFDYIHASTPILCSGLIEIERIVEKYEIGKVVNEISPESIANAINELLSNPSTLEQMQLNCQKAALVENWENEKKTLVELLNSIR